MNVLFENANTQRPVQRTRLDKLPRANDHIRLGSGWWSVVKVFGNPFAAQVVTVWVEPWEVL